MDLQQVFYITGIIFMLAWVVLLVIAGYVLWVIQKEVKRVPEHVQNVVSHVIERNKGGIMGIAGTFVVPFVLNLIRKKIFKR